MSVTPFHDVMLYMCRCNDLTIFSFFLSSSQLSFSFSFFVHGESSVCTAVEIQQQQQVRHLRLEDVAVAATKQEGLPGNVIWENLSCFSCGFKLCTVLHCLAYKLPC